MATLQELRSLKNTIPGIQITETFESRGGRPIIRIHFRKPSFLNPEQSQNYQYEIARKFISSAGWLGVGAGKGSDFLPAADSDFIYTYSIYNWILFYII